MLPPIYNDLKNTCSQRESRNCTSFIIKRNLQASGDLNAGHRWPDFGHACVKTVEGTLKVEHIAFTVRDRLSVDLKSLS